MNPSNRQALRVILVLFADLVLAVGTVHAEIMPQKLSFAKTLATTEPTASPVASLRARFLQAKPDVVLASGKITDGVVVDGTGSGSAIVVETLKCECMENPLGVDNPQPRFCWTLSSPIRGQTQAAYQVLVGQHEDDLQQPGSCVWDSGTVLSDRSIHVEYEGPPLQSGHTYFWAVRVWDGNGEASRLSRAGHFTMGLLRAADWSNAQWISAKSEPEYMSVLKARRDAEDRVHGAAGVEGFYLNSPIWDLYSFEPKLDPAPLLRRSFQVEPGKKIESAWVSISGLGYYELHVNGTKISGTVNPARSDYDMSVPYRTHDVAGELKSGENVLGVILGHGYYNMITRGTYGESEAPWTGEPKLLLKLHVRYSDGAEAVVVSDGNWKCFASAILWNDVRAGEVYDARHERDGWDKPGFSDASWRPVHRTPAPRGALVAELMPPVRETQTIRPVKVEQTSPGVFVYDMGQNFSGWARLKVKGPAGAKITVSHAEQPTGGEAFIPGEMQRRQQYVYILKGSGEEEIFEPHFNYYGFQYVQVKGFPGTATLDNIEGVVVHTDLQQIGQFECGNPLLNRLQTNVLWTLRNLIHGYPQDCPHREKQGWTDYNTLAAKTQVLNFDSVLFFEKWMRDCRDQFSKHKDGLNVVVPHSNGSGCGDPAWAGAWAVCSWRNYLYYGDRKILEDNYEAWKQWVEVIRAQQAESNLIMTGIGDWVAPYTYGRWAPAGPEGPAISSSSYYYHIVDVVAQTAGLLGKREDAATYRAWADAIKSKFNARFYNRKTGMYETDDRVGFRQSSQVIPMSLGLVPKEYYAELAKSLDDNIFAKNDGHLDTGTIGTSHLLNVLPRLENHEAAYSVVSQTTYPSWLLPIIKHNATTVWEGWDWAGSHNHSCYLSVGAYFYEGLAGIRPDPAAPGFKHVIIRPGMPRALDSASGAIQSPYGEIRSAWRREGGRVLFDVTVPVNTWATLSVPKDGCGKVTIGESGAKVWDGAAFTSVAGLEKATEEADYVTFKAGSGSYRFEVTPVDAALAFGRTLRVEWAATPSPILGEPGTRVPFVLILSNRSETELADAQLELEAPSDCRLECKDELGTIPPGASRRVECVLSTPVSANGCRSVAVPGVIRAMSRGKAAKIPLAVRLNLRKLVMIQCGTEQEVKTGLSEPVKLVNVENCSGMPQALTLRCKLPQGWKSLKSLPYVATASSVLDDNNRPERLCDHIVNHSENNRWHSALAAPVPHVITMKLKELAKVNRLVLHASSFVVYCKKVRLEYLGPDGAWKMVCEPELKREYASTIPVNNVLAREFRLTILEVVDQMNPGNPHFAQLNEIEICAEDSPKAVQTERIIKDREVDNLELNLDPGSDIGKPRTIEIVVDKEGKPYWQGMIQLTGRRPN